ncbi:UNVERIFIED_CONTAM: hypothetical protein GTU68_045237 [Idotea baltica]|nr:hypothetical protein [Idotea baltica]
MFFNSLDFAVFFPVVFVLYWLVARNRIYRNLLLLVASYVFYGWWDWRFLFLIFISSLVDFFVGQYIYKTDDQKRRKIFLFVSLAVNLGFLIYFKYTNFFIDTFVDSFRLFGKELEVTSLNIILPVGISFYTFQTLSYTIDIYRRQLEPTKDALSFFAFVAFFPQLVAGPIERATHLLPQFYKTYKFNYKQVKSGLLLIAFGLFKKMVIADRAAVYVNEIYNHPLEFQGIQVILATVLFAFQIYCDFSGYSDIAIGIARTMGFDLMKNFDSPYFSKSITEFWRRWHISLSTWFRDYVYIPLGGSRVGKYRMYLNLFLVFFISGIWHGAAMTFVIWGAIHGVIIVLEKATFKTKNAIYVSSGLNKNTFSNNLFFTTITFIVVCFAWVFFRANSVHDAFLILKQSFVFSNSEGIYTAGIDAYNMNILLVSILILIMFELTHKRINLYHFLNNQSVVFRWSVYFFIIFSIFVFRELTIQEFIYFQF